MIRNTLLRSGHDVRGDHARWNLERFFILECQYELSFSSQFLAIIAWKEDFPTDIPKLSYFDFVLSDFLQLQLLASKTDKDIQSAFEHCPDKTGFVVAPLDTRRIKGDIVKMLKWV